MIEFEQINLVAISSEYLALIVDIAGSLIAVSLSVSLIKLGVWWVKKYV